MHRYQLLDPLRGIAAFWVFAFHHGFSEAFQTTIPWLHHVARHGDLGVPMFFVLSGFCITAAARATVAKTRTTLEFLRRRLWRIYPTFWCSILVTVLVPFVVEGLSSLKSGRYTPPSSLHLNYRFLNYDAWDWAAVFSLAQVFRNIPNATNLQAKFTTINAVYWTLAIEIQFYLVVSACLLFRRFFFGSLIAVTILCVALSSRHNLVNTGLFIPFWPMFALGVLVNWCGTRDCSHETSRSVRAHRLVAAALVLGMATWVLIADEIAEIAFAIVFAATLYFLHSWDDRFIACSIGSRFSVISWITAGLVFLGTMSYSLYLLHGRLRFLAMVPMRQFVPANSIAFDIGVLIITIALCAGFYWCCEYPVLKLLRSPSRIKTSDLAPHDTMLGSAPSA